ncbi:hypothetical protein DQM11_09025 [Leuconostoc pseudomesenteroides]|nr:hypothetical protein DQM11_09025 [Leuconostoc pseudomesenteroides]
MSEKGLNSDQKLYSSHINDIFDTVDVTIHIEDIGSFDLDDSDNDGLDFEQENNYNVVNFSFDNGYEDEALKDIFKEIKTKVCADNSNEEKRYSEKRDGWSAFYLIKELVEKIETQIKEGETLFYRGQNNNWSLEPSAYRSGTGGYKTEYRDEFDYIYKNIAYRYPEKVKYYGLGKKKRVFALAELQHYGLPTPLIDLTDNPFIAMLFMVDGFDYKIFSKNSSSSPEFDIFIIDKEKHSLYQDVPKNRNNPRIDAQRGSFLNFENLVIDGSVEPIKRIRVLFKNFDDAEVESANGTESNIQNAFDGLASDIKLKLSQFHYDGSELYPDFDKYLEYTKSRYRPNFVKARLDQ